MDIKGSLVIGASIVVASIVLGLTLAPKSPAPASTPAGAQVGRFQMGGAPGHAYIIDTAIGQVWEKFAIPSEGTTDQEFNRPKIK